MVIALVLGIGLSGFIHEYFFVWFVVAGTALLGASYLAFRRQRFDISLALGLAAVCLAGSLNTLAGRNGTSTYDLRRLISRGLFKLGEPVYFEGCVTDDGHEEGADIVSTISFSAFQVRDQWIPCQGKGRIRIAVPGRKDPQAPTLGLLQGDRVRAWATWRWPVDYRNPGCAQRKQALARKGIYVVGRIKSPRLVERLPGGCSNIWTKSIVAARSHIRAALEAIQLSRSNQPAALLASILIGDYTHLNDATREVFQNSGSFHVLVVSGLHVAWLACLTLNIFKFLRVAERVRYLSTALLIFFYAGIVGFQASITRSLWMFIFYLLGRTLLRRSDPANIVFACAFLLLVVKPNWLFETGFQLSFLSVIAITMSAAPCIENYLKPLLNPLRHAGRPDCLFLQPGYWHRTGRILRARCEILFEAAADRSFPLLFNLLCQTARAAAHTVMATGTAFLITVWVQVWIASLLAHSFNRISWISPLANLVIIPMASMVLVAGLLSIASYTFHIYAPALLQLTEKLSSLFLSCAHGFTSIKNAWQRCPTPSAAWVLLGIALLFAWSYFKWRRSWIPLCYTAIFLALLSLGSVPVPAIVLDFVNAIWHREQNVVQAHDKNLFAITFLDVGQGESIFIRFPNDKVWLLDAGSLFQFSTREEGRQEFDLGEEVVSRFLWHQWLVKMDRLILSHADTDHAGGTKALLKNFRVTELVHSQIAADFMVDEIMDTARARKTSILKVYAGRRENIGGVSVNVLHPPSDFAPLSGNEASLVVQFCYRRFSVLLTGDMDQAGERAMLSHYPSPRSLLLKVAHHGSRSGTSNLLLNAVQPRWAVISVGRNNPYGHPSGDVLSRLLRRGIRIFTTPDHGAIRFETDGNQYRIQTHIGGIIEKGNL